VGGGGGWVPSKVCNFQRGLGGQTHGRMFEGTARGTAVGLGGGGELPACTLNFNCKNENPRVGFRIRPKHGSCLKHLEVLSCQIW